ncbi:hypothetical protein ACHAW6_011326 [Cyclotella cf. meneghiniana]
MTTTADPPQPPEPSRRKKRRWGDSGPANDSVANGKGDGGASEEKSGFSSSPPSSIGIQTNGSGAAVADPAARKAALQASIQARLAALKARTTQASAMPSRPAPTPVTASGASTLTNIVAVELPNDKKRHISSTPNEAKKRARVFELDLNETVPTRLLEKQRQEELLQQAEPKEKLNPYLAHTHTAVTTGDRKEAKGANDTTQIVTNEDEILDSRLAGGQIVKPRLKSRPISFVTPGTYIALGEKKRQQAARAEESGYVSGRKDGRVITSVGMGGVAAGETSGLYGAGEAGRVIDDRLPGRIDAPELEVEDYFIGGKKYKHSKEKAELSELDKRENAVKEAILAAESAMPYAMEWWDAELLPVKLRKELAAEEGKAIASRAKKQASSAVVVDDANKSDPADTSSPEEKHIKCIERCYKHASLTNSKSHSLVQHPIPILTPAQKAAAEALKNKPPTLHLTKAERKRHRKLRRAERLREQQDMQAAGLIPPPEPRLTLSNYMKVLGDQAVLDPSKMEAKVMEQIHQRKLKHERMNDERKLTKEQKAAKHARKLAEDTSASVKVALFWVRDMSHPYHRAKVDLNAQQNNITGGVLECDQPGKSEDDKLVLVVAEGGEKAIKRYVRLMTVRMRWRGEDFYEEEEEEEEELMVGEDEGENGEQKQAKQERKKFNPNNCCELIWTGMAVKRSFHTFMFQSAQNMTVARKIMEAKGVAHYWDMCVGFVERWERGEGKEGMRFRLGGGDEYDDEMMTG